MTARSVPAKHPKAKTWLRALEVPDDGFRRVLHDTYGPDERVLSERRALLHAVVGRFLERFGDRPLRLLRCPGRLNLRGMHVDTHGGYLNLMTHQREVVVAATASDDATTIFANTDPAFEDVAFDAAEVGARRGLGGDWMGFITRPEVRAAVETRRGHWGHYLEGCFLNVQHRFPERPLRGIRAVVGSDLPRGAALSSSAALCTAVVMAVLAHNGLGLERVDLVPAAREAEWYTGSRCGLSDQTAMILAGKNEVLNVALFGPEADFATARRLPFSGELRVLVVNSYTERSLSGAGLVGYTMNRFAYSLALEILRQEARAQGAPEKLRAKMDRLSHLRPATLAPMGGARFLYRLLLAIPESLPLDELRARYDVPKIEEAYERYFGGVPESERPDLVALRGPLLFGIAESERARVFADALEAGAWAEAGRLMRIGHDGDRRVCADGSPYEYDVSDGALRRLADAGGALHACPGVYGASTPVLDALVDAALEAGALGASLTGAGMAGSVLALCHAGEAEDIAAALRHRMGAAAYAAASGRDQPLCDGELAQAVVTNTATAPAGELHLASHRQRTSNSRH